MGLLQIDPDGLWCEAGGFHIDPWGAVPKALITHGHSDHARPGSAAYLCSELCALILKERLGPEVHLQAVRYGSPLRIGEVSVSFHPAGHVLGSSQIRVEHRGEVWVVSGDYKLARDTTCTPFEPVRCQTFVTESTFGLPIFRWAEQSEVLSSIGEWQRVNRERGKCSVIFAYPLGKSQRVLAGLVPEAGPIFCHGAVERMNRVYRATGVGLPPTLWPGDTAKGYDWTKALVIAPPSAQGSAWMKRFGAVSTAYVSGWMRIRGTRRRKSIDRGFVLSDHADWPGLQTAIRETGAERVLVTHGYRAPMVRWLSEQGLEAAALDTRFEGERDEVEDVAAESE
jgi:putative mRNA 3-end processing factor